MSPVIRKLPLDPLEYTMWAFKYLVLILALIPLFLCGQSDYASLLGRVDSLSSDHSHQEFLEALHVRDQKYRGSKANMDNDYENIVLASMYVNRYGYPASHLQSTSKILPYIWIHCWHNEVRELSFPIIWQGYLSGDISSQLLRKYFLRGLYKTQSDDSDYLSLSTEQILKKLRPQLEGEIDLDSIHEIHHNYKELLDNLSEPIGLWGAEHKEETHTMPDGGVITRAVDRLFIEMRTYNDVKYMRRYNKNWLEDTFKPIIEIGEKRFKYAHASSKSNYYELTEDDQIILRNARGEALSIYDSVLGDSE